MKVTWITAIAATVGRLVVRNDSEDFTSLFTMMTVSPRAHSGSDQRVNLLFSHILPASTGVHRRHRATGRSREGRTAAGRRWAALYRRRASKGQIPQTGAGADDQRCPQRPSHAHGPQEAGDVRWVLLLNHQLHISVRALEKQRPLVFSISMLEEDLRAKKALIWDFFFSSLSLIL